jgi:hypothetical protein
MDRWTYDGWAWEASSDRRLDARARSEGRSPSYLTKRYTKLLHNFMIQLATRKLWADIFMVYRWTLALETWYRLYESYLQTRSTHHMPEPNMREEPSSA